jgi:ketosteroid isomerase-like protein
MNAASAALVDEVYRTYRIDERGPMLALLLDDVVFRIEGDPERLSFTGVWHGHAGVNEHLDRLDAEWEIPRFTPVDRASEGAHVAVRIDMCWRHRGSGRETVLTKIDFWTIRAGKVAEFHQVLDSARLERCAFGS